MPVTSADGRSDSTRHLRIARVDVNVHMMTDPQGDDWIRTKELIFMLKNAADIHELQRELLTLLEDHQLHPHT